MEENNQNPRLDNNTDIESVLDKKMNRRRFLRNAGLAAGLLAGAGLIGSAIPLVRSLESDGPTEAVPEEGLSAASTPATRPANYPFKLGVASGDPLTDGVVLWTRLVSQTQNSKGGMEPKPYTVQWEVAKDEAFRQIVKSGSETAIPEFAHSIHAEVSGLAPDSWYYYRFKLGTEISPIGRTKTAPAADANPDSLTFAFASCQHFASGYYTAYEHMVKEEIDVLFFLGDYIYEDGKTGVWGRSHYPGKTVSTLNDYRLRYMQYKTDPLLQAAHEAFPWIVAPDDHEVKNNWAGNGPPYDNNKEFLARRTAAYQAYYEHMPLRKAALPKGPEMLLYRRFKYGKLAEFSVLDTRQFRSEYSCSDDNGFSACEERMDPSRTMLGTEQERWLLDGLSSSSAQWKVIPQQVIMAQRDREKGMGVEYNMDKWDGYTETRDRLFNVVRKQRLENLIVLTGDQHNNWVNELKEDFNDPKSPVVGIEFLGTSISSGGNGSDMNEEGRTALAENKHIKFYNNQRGYVVCRVSPKEWRTYFRVLQYVDRTGSPISTRATFVIEAGKPEVIRL
jgi:alkaline phosphatase D